MTTLEQIQEKIIVLPPNDKMKLFKWFADLDDQIWDKQIEKDFQEGGTGSKLLEKIKADFAAGKCVKWD